MDSEKFSPVPARLHSFSLFPTIPGTPRLSPGTAVAKFISSEAQERQCTKFHIKIRNDQSVGTPTKINTKVRFLISQEAKEASVVQVFTCLRSNAGSRDDCGTSFSPKLGPPGVLQRRRSAPALSDAYLLNTEYETRDLVKSPSADLAFATLSGRDEAERSHATSL